jgi:hypothetical protein
VLLFGHIFRLKALISRGKVTGNELVMGASAPALRPG